MQDNIQTNQRAQAVHLWLVLSRAAHVIEMHAVRSIESMGIGKSDFAVLEALLHKGPLPVNLLGRKVLLTSGSITTAVDRLEERGYVRRCNDAKDRRARIVSLTQAGSELAEKLFAAHADDMECAAAVISEEEQVTLIHLLRKLGLGAGALLHSPS